MGEPLRNYNYSLFFGIINQVLTLISFFFNFYCFIFFQGTLKLEVQSIQAIFSNGSIWDVLRYTSHWINCAVMKCIVMHCRTSLYGNILTVPQGIILMGYCCLT